MFQCSFPSDIVLEYSRDEVNRRLVDLEQRGFVIKVERGKYRISVLGRQYLDGSVTHSLRGQLRHLWDVTFKN